MIPSRLPATLIALYQKTHYRVNAATPFTLEVGLYSPALEWEYEERGTHACAFITAWNPHGQAESIAVNARHQAQLTREIAQRGLSTLPGIGLDPDGDYPGEESLLAFGLNRSGAAALGRQFHQNAIVWCGTDAVAQLILLV